MKNEAQYLKEIRRLKRENQNLELGNKLAQHTIKKLESEKRDLIIQLEMIHKSYKELEKRNK
jgi:hypothetical protein